MMEYKIIRFRESSTNEVPTEDFFKSVEKDAEGIMNKWGAEGWSLHSTLLPFHPVLIFHREKTS